MNYGLLAAVTLVLFTFAIRYIAGVNSKINSLKAMLVILGEEKAATQEILKKPDLEEQAEREAFVQYRKTVEDYNYYASKYNALVENSPSNLIAKRKNAVSVALLED